jgi:tagaturonate reductase
LVINGILKNRNMNLTKENVKNIKKDGIVIPGDNIFELPEKVLQFGTGVLLRGLPDYFIDKANKQGVFNGRVIVVKSTDSDSNAFDAQNNLYTVCVRGMENGRCVEDNIINASISRVLNAKTEWDKIIAYAANPAMQIVISNTTEVGIQHVEDMLGENTPISFPGKLLSFLIERFKIFKGSKESGMVIVPTELISDNGSKLKAIVLQLAVLNNLNADCIEWIKNENYFCNSLVDRIVPGKPSTEELLLLQNELGYKDDLLSMSEVFRLWAIEGNDYVKEILSFASVDAGVVIQNDITLFKELKLRLLNGTHTFNCGTAFLSGFTITRDAVNDMVFSKFAKQLMQQEIAIAIPYEIDAYVKTEFANNVFERFQNPYINHQWQSITVQYTSKMKMRNVPLITNYFTIKNEVPACMALGFAAYLLYMKATKKDGDKYYGSLKNEDYLITDDAAAYFYEMWHVIDAENLAEIVLSDVELWGTDLTTLPMFTEAVTGNLIAMLNNGVAAVLNTFVQKMK